MLLQQALIGTASGHAGLPDVPEDVLAALPEGAIEQRMLLAAGALAVYREAGRQPAQQTLPAPAPTEHARQPSPQLQAIIDECVKGEWEPWWPRAAERLARHGYVVGTARLVATLNAVKPRDAALWRPLLGARGRWLAVQNSEWSWAAEQGVAQDRGVQWQEGNPAQRAAALLAQRAEDAAVAREWLGAVWKGEKAEARQALLETFATGLSPSDDDFLSACLSDRSQAVRGVAAGLLATLPDSALAQRLATRARAWVNWQPAQGALGKMAGKVTGVAGTLRVEPPAAWEKAWAKDGFEETPPQGEGARAFWLRQLVAHVPPVQWQAHTGLTPEVFIKAALATDWAEPLVVGLASAAQHFRDAQWALALLRGLPDKAEKWLHAEDLLRVVPAPQRDALCAERVRSGAPRAVHALQRCAWPWSEPLNEAVQRAAKDALNAGGGDDTALALTEQAALNLPAAALAALRTAWQEALSALESRTNDWRARNAASQLRRQLDLVERRMQFDKEVAP